MKKLISLAVVALFVFSLSVSAMAANHPTGTYDFNGIVVPLPDDIPASEFEELDSLGLYSIFSTTYTDVYWLYIFDVPFVYNWEESSLTNNSDITANILRYKYSDGVWAESDVVELAPSETYDQGFLIFHWASYNPYEYCYGSVCPATDVNEDNLCDDCGMPFSVPRDYSFTVAKFMNHIGQILTSAVSWVSDVGAAIFAQPLLLAFTALPLCGLGIAVFRRLKNTV